MPPARVYLDYAATTPVDERVLAAMLPYFRDEFGNPSSVHRSGQAADAAVASARARVAQVFACQPDEIIFTSGGTESDNLALRGVALARARQTDRRHLLISALEHPAVANAARHLARHHGFEVEVLPVDVAGRLDPETLRRALRQETALVSVIHASNEIGTISPIRALADVCAERRVPLHTDSVQAAAHLPIEAAALGADLISIGAHKFYGPKGVGALFCRHGLELEPIQPGGEQESGRRGGTENVPLIVGLATAFELVQAERPARATRLSELRDRLISGVLASVTGSRLTGDPDTRLPNHASFVFQGADSNRLLAALDLAGFACSSGSACKTGDPEPSSVLLAIGLSESEALGSLRVTLGEPTTVDQVEQFLKTLPEVIGALRSAPVPA